VKLNVYGPDSLWVESLGEATLPPGYNRIPYDLSIAEAQVKPLQDALNKGKDADNRVRIRKADDGKHYLPKGEYRVEVSGDFGTKSTSFLIE
jgi:hypothetical protein